MIPNNILNLLAKNNMNLGVFQNMQSPDEIAQYLLNTGKVTQDQVNKAKQMWENPQTKQQIQNNPIFQSMLNMQK